MHACVTRIHQYSTRCRKKRDEVAAKHTNRIRNGLKKRAGRATRRKAKRINKWLFDYWQRDTNLKPVRTVQCKQTRPYQSKVYRCDKTNRKINQKQTNEQKKKKYVYQFTNKAIEEKKKTHQQISEIYCVSTLCESLLHYLLLRS